ncbi:cell division protein FtsX [Limisalsivibrio acetivorans]|uniref:cell division protein FtsX n=1 Tax=Limisalsivibrio acetivorans TaxID=1304888 RepID=UPI0003B2EA9F|nr:permease-like cell division protein FtsX [Limisalsivibrio acetivorans]
MNRLRIMLQHGFRLFRETMTLNVASVITVVTVLFIYNMFVVVGISVDSFLKEMTRVNSIRVYLRTENKIAIDELRKDFADLQGVEEVVYYSSEDSFKHLQETTVNINYLDKIPEDLFPSFIEVKVEEGFQDGGYIRKLERQIIAFENVDVASYGEKWVQNFSDIRSAVKLFMIILTMFLTISMGIIIFNTIRLSLFRYREDIQIYSLVGATRSFIEMPYLISSFVEVSIGFVLSSSVVYGFMLFLNNKLLAPVELDFVLLPGLGYYIKTYLFLIFVSIIASMLSVTSFLNKVKSINDP